MKNIIAVLAVSTIFAVSSCKKTDSKNTVAAETGEKIETAEQFTVDSVKLSDSTKVNNLLSLKYEAKMLLFPTIKDKSLLDSIYYDKKGIIDFSKQGLQTFLNKDKDEYFASVKEKDNSGINDIARPQSWDTGSFMKLKSNTNDYLQIEYMYSSYEGGAHGNYGFAERVFDLKNKKRVLLKDITTMPKARLEALLTKNINNIPSGTTDSQGAVKNSEMLLIDAIPANDNFYFDDKNLYFHYSPYEIAAFAAGDIIIPVSWEDLKGTLNPQFKERMKIN